MNLEEIDDVIVVDSLTKLEATATSPLYCLAAIVSVGSNSALLIVTLSVSSFFAQNSAHSSLVILHT